MIWNPMLAGEAVLGSVEYPTVALPKLNGIRGLNQGGLMYARSLKPIPNDYVRELFSLPELDGLEGELVVGDYAHEEVFSNSTSGVMTKEGVPPIQWHIFDMFHPNWHFVDRLAAAREVVYAFDDPRITIVEAKVLQNDDELVEFSNYALGAGYEGLVLRDPYATYKQGRSTSKEGGFLRYCPWFRSEAVVIAIEEGKVNLNESKRDERGYLKKSSHKANKVGSGRAGAFVVRDVVTGVQFNMPVPTVALQQEVMANVDKWIGRLIKYKYKPPVIKGGKPRFPQYEGLRHPDDMS